MPLVPQRLSSSIVPAEVLEDLAVDDSTSPLGVKAATNPGMQSTIRRGLAFALAQRFIGYGELARASRFIRCGLDWSVHVTPPPGRGRSARSRRREASIVRAPP
jgi:hypothetical protein